MAEQTGVSSPREGESRGSSGGKIAPFVKRNKVLVYGGGAVAAMLVLSHRGKAAAGGSASDPANQLQAASDYIAASNAAAAQAQGDPQLQPGGGFPVDTGGGSYTAQGPTATLAPGPTNLGPVNVSPPNVTVINTPAVPTAPQAPAASHAKAASPPHHPGKPAEHKTVTEKKAGTPAAHQRTATKAPAKPSQPHPTPPHPANYAGKHPASPKKSAQGHAKNSPVEVEAMVGAGAGVVICGREFPGARGYREGPPMQGSNGRVARHVTVDYGGHTETHLMHGNGDSWTDRVPGLNPPSRGVPASHPGGNRAQL